MTPLDTESLRSRPVSNGMNLLIVTQAVDLDNPILGFFHRWIEEFAKQCERITVICLEEGRHSLPPNVRVYSLGKERGASSRFSYALRFWKLIWKLRNDYDSVFVHMNPEYVILGGWLWKLLGKKTALWYTHKSVTASLRLAMPLTNIVFTASPESFRLTNPKVHVVGHGIDVESYAGALVPMRSPMMLVSVGRITPIKHLEIMIEALKILKDAGVRTHLTFVGAPIVPSDVAYKTSLHSLVRTLGLDDDVSFRGSVPHGRMPEEYRRYDISINMAPTGGVDKAVLESMAAGVLVVVANKAFTRYLGGYSAALLSPASPEELARRLRALSESGETDTIRRSLREMVQKSASLNAIVAEILREMRTQI